jgi:hypothetical protein
MALSITNIVAGNVVNDYGLDNVPYTVGTTGSTTMLLAYIGWTVAQEPYQNSGIAPAVNVTDSADNLWRQVGISTVSTSSRGAIWVADNPRQTQWVSVALTGWASSTAYAICEMDGIPITLGAVSLDFVKTLNQTAFSTSLTIAATATTTDTVFGLVTTGGNCGSFTVPTGWTAINIPPAGLAGGATALDATTAAMWIPTQNSGALPSFAPTWANSVPSTGIVVGLKQTAAIPVQTNANFPNVVVEAAFGATPGDFTQSVDYTWDNTGLTWTDISSRSFSKGDDATIRVSMGRQYESSQEETGQIEILLDNHDGAFTFNNSASPYYPNVIPGTPIRITAWWQGVQYPIAFGYVQTWPQEWPDMPQWGFSSVIATDAWGALASTNLPSAVEGDIRKDNPYFYFPTDEQYEFTSQSLTPTASPLDANGLIAVNKAFGNNRYGAYRDGFDQGVTVGQALNLLGDEDTTLGATTYTAQETADNGPGLFYFDPNIPTNSNNAGFAAEFWFVWGNEGFSCAMMSAWGRPSSFFGTQTVPTNGGCIAVGINTGINDSGTVSPGFYVNGVAVDGGTAFNQVTFAPQHFVLTTGPNGTQTYLNGSLMPNAPTMGIIPQIKAASLGPARFSYDVSDLVVYNGFNYVAGHFAWYNHELTALQVQNHFTSGIDGFLGTPAPGRFAQVLTWGRLGMKRGGTAWFNTYGSPEGTYMSEAYSYEGTNASDVMNQIVQTEGGRCYTQGNGSIIYKYRWYLYNQTSKFTFGDNGTTEIPFDQNTSFAVDSQFIYNLITATQNRGPNQDFFVLDTNAQSILQYFMRSGLQIQSYAMLPFDVFDVTNWSATKYGQPQQRVVQLSLDASKTAGKVPSVFNAVLSLQLSDIITINRRPIGGATISTTGGIQKIQHEIGATYWKTMYQISPLFPESSALFADVSGQNTPGTQYLSW